MSIFKQRARIVLSLLLTALLVALELMYLAQPNDFKLVTRVESLLYDVRFNLLPPQRDPIVPIVLVDIDEASIQQQGRWPWDRKKIAQLIDALRHQGVQLIGLDIIFSEPSPNTLSALLSESTLPAAVKAWLVPWSAQFNSDQVLAEAVSDNTVLGYFLQNDGASTGVLPFPFYQLSQAERERNAIMSMDNYSASIEPLALSALGQGFVVAVPDLDGVVRRAPLVLRHQDGLYASLPLLMAQYALGAPWLKMKLVDNGHQWVATELDLGGRARIALNADGSVLVPFKGYAGAFLTLPAGDVLAQRLSPTEKQALRQALVLVGTSALGLSDLRTMPLQTSYPGVEVHANVLDALLQSATGGPSLYRVPDWSNALSVLLLLGLGLLLSLLLPGRSPLWLLLGSLSALMLVVGANAWFWQVEHWALPMAMPLLLVLVLGGVNFLLGFIETNQHKRNIQKLFGEYVPPAYVEQMLNQTERISMDGEQRWMTVLFADVVGFTASSEKLSTTELKSWLNQYLSAVTEVIFSHQGTIDKYVGDLVMAFFNAPLSDPQHALHGLQTALAMQQKVRELAPLFQAQGLPEIAIGIGVNTGLMNVGDMGSRYRRAYTVLGDAVNLASRLESLTRFYGVGILVSAESIRDCPDLLCWPIDRIRVKGKQEPIDVFEPLGTKEQLSPALLDELQAFTEAVTAYRAGAFARARAGFQALLPTTTRRKLCQCYLDRLSHLGENSEPEWQAVFTHQEK